MNHFNHFFRTFLCFLALSMVYMGMSAQPSQLKYGQSIVTCFSGHVGNNPNNPIANDYVLGMIDVRDHAPAPLGAISNWMPPMAHPGTIDSLTWKSDSMGQVFGLAIDDEGNFYVAASTVYGSYPSGNAGSGGIYKIDANTWQATPFITTLASPSGAVVGTSLLPNIRVGLGNMCFDGTHTQFFVTNHEDGKIYRIDKVTGLVLSVFDPMGADNGLVGFAPKGERLWGIGYHESENKVYYSVWEEDQRNSTTNTLFNTIRSVSLDGTGEFVPSSDQLEITMPPVIPTQSYSSPVSDIAFSSDGRMLLAERGMNGDMGNQFQTGIYAHRARVLEYTGSTGSWTGSPVTKFSVGINARNSSGGVDFGYESFSPNNQGPGVCDSMVWATGDALHPTTPTTWYGVQGMRAGGGAPANSIIVDLDGVPNLIRKTQTGDLEIFDDCVRTDPCAILNIQADFLHTSPTVADPTADFTDVSTVAAGYTIAFIDWCFPDTTITQGAGGTVSYTYDSTGTYQVCLKTYAFAPLANGGALCCKDEFCMDIFVPSDTCDYHEADIACVGDPIDPFTITFTDSSLLGDHTVWTVDTAGAQANYFGQGLGHTVSYTFPGPGVYTVCMVSFWHVDSVLCCLDTAYKTVVISPQGVDPCDTLKMNFLCTQIPGAPGYIFEPNSTFPLYEVCWDFDAPGGVTDTTSGSSPITHIFPGPGTYTVCGVAKWILSTGVLCTDTVCKQVIIQNTANPCNYGASMHTNVTQTNFLTATDLTPFGSICEWDFDAPSGIDLVTPAGATVNHTFPGPGTYTVCMHSTWYYNPGDSTQFCKKTVCTIIVIPGIIIGPAISLEVGPVPAEKELHIQYPPTAGDPVDIQLYSSQGIVKQVLKADGSGSARMNVSTMESGMYILEVRSKEYRLTKKVIKR